MTAPLDDDALAFAEQLFGLAREGEAERLGAYLDAGVPVDLTNSKGDTLLLLAAYHRHAEAVRVLLEHGADVGRINDRGQTALAAAAFRSDTEMVRILLGAGASPHDGGPSALETARFFDLPEMVALLADG